MKLLKRFRYWLQHQQRVRDPKAEWILCFAPHDAPEPRLFLTLGKFTGTHDNAMDACQMAVGLLCQQTGEVQAGKYFVIHASEEGDIESQYPVGGERARA